MKKLSAKLAVLFLSSAFILLGGCSRPAPIDSVYTPRYLSHSAPAAGEGSSVEKISSSEELSDFYASIEDYWSSEEYSWISASIAGEWERSISSALEFYGEEVFPDKEFLFVFITASSGSFSYEVNSVVKGENGYTVNVSCYTPEIGTCDMRYWLILLDFDKGTFEEGAEFSLNVTRVSV